MCERVRKVRLEGRQEHISVTELADCRNKASTDKLSARYLM